MSLIVVLNRAKKLFYFGFTKILSIILEQKQISNLSHASAKFASVILTPKCR